MGSQDKVLFRLELLELLNVLVISLLLLFSLQFQGKIMPMGLHLEFLKALVLILVPQQILNHDQKLLKLDLHILYLCNIKMLVVEHPKSFIMKVWKNHTVKKKRSGINSFGISPLDNVPSMVTDAVMPKNTNEGQNDAELDTTASLFATAGD